MTRTTSTRWLERCLWLTGIVLLAWVGYVWADGRAYQARAAAELEWARTEAAAGRPEATGGRRGSESAVAMPDELPGDGGDEPKASRSPATEPEPAATRIVGRLEIPRLDLSVMVSEGTTPRVLRRGAGHLSGTPFPGARGNAAIAGHRDRHFRPLERINPGDELIFTGVDGTYRYEVEWTEIVRPEETRVLAATEEPSLTLVTCYPFSFVGHAPQRFIVRARQIGAEPLAAPAGG